MSTYPGALDDLGSTNPTPTTPTNDGDGHAAQHSAANDAIDAIQETLGVNPFGGSTDVATRLDDLAFADLADVDMSGLSDGDVPVWNSGTSKFEPGAGGGGGGGGGLVPILSGTFSASSAVTQDTVLDTAYEYELVIHLTSVGTGTPQLNFRGRASGSDVTSGSYYLAGWAKSWSGGIVGWGGANGATTMPLHYQGAANLVARVKLLQDTSTRWSGHLESVSNSTGIACDGGLQVTAAIDGFTFYPATSTITGDWALYRRSRT